MTTLAERPLSKDELNELIRCDYIMATMKNPATGEFIVRNAEARREYEIRANVMKIYRDTVQWINPNADISDCRRRGGNCQCQQIGECINA